MIIYHSETNLKSHNNKHDHPSISTTKNQGFYFLGGIWLMTESKQSICERCFLLQTYHKTVTCGTILFLYFLPRGLAFNP